MPFTRTRARTHTQTGGTVTGFPVLHTGASVQRLLASLSHQPPSTRVRSSHAASAPLLLSCGQRLASSVPFISLTSVRPFLLCPCVCPSRRPPSSKPVWRNSWRSSCPRSRRTCAASSPMTPNKQVCRRFSVFDADVGAKRLRRPSK